VLVTGYDIIFFWVVRMVFSALETTGEVPFHDVYVHGLVRDAQGRKMSKSLGNGIDPLEIIDQYGADALRFMLTTGITPGNDMRFKTDRLEAARNFANKLWNASRFVIMNLEDDGELAQPDPAALKDEDKWILSRLNDAVKYVTETMEKYDLALAGQRVYDLIWNEYCDWYIELVKARLYGEDEADKQVARYVLVSVLRQMLCLLHPFMPFITEEIWGYLPGGDPESVDPKDFLIRADWPLYDEAKTYPAESEILEMAMAIIRSIRNIRAEAEAAPGKKLHGVILAGADKEAICRAAGPYIRNLANLSDLQFIADRTQVPEEVMSAVVDGAEVFIPLDDLMDYEAELARLQKEKKRLEGEVKRVVGKLNNQGFVSKAPEKVVAEERAKKDKYEEMLAKVSERLALVERKLG
ncbi:MAG: class I tRNA ligase family protein, partial [Firmicutes bacterium]|nr:class I tRNA ligase family protein [Bacillota bacterium]